MNRGPDGDGTALFMARYHSLRLLLAANNKALDTMAEMEEAALGSRVFGMAFVRSRCTAAGVSVFSMVRHLDALAPQKYAELFPVLEQIQGRIQSLLTVSGPAEAAPLVIRLSDIDRSSADTVGSKMANLGEIGKNIRLRVPPGFAITDAAFDVLLTDSDLKPEIDSLIQTADHERPAEIFALSSRLQQLVVNAPVPARLAEAVAAAYEELAETVGGHPAVAMRSSAIGEDSPEASFAGQYRTELNVRRENLLDAYRQVAASKYTPQAMQYLLQRGLRDDQLAMCVGCIAMVDARSGGVAYTGNPHDPADRRVIINAAPGLPKAVVDGEFAADEFVLSREDPPTIVARRIASKTARLILDPVEGLAREALPESERETPSLDDDEARRVAEAAILIERHFGSPQDVEWALDREGQVVVLQSRPLQQFTPGASVVPGNDGAEPLVAGGICVSPGAAAGPVVRVERDSDALRFPDGAVLVVSHPLPKWAALLPRAVAVVSAEGGIAGHLATVARESGVPALFQLADLSALEEGVEVTVDADRRAVYAGIDQKLIGARPERQSVMSGSPVHETLLAALQHIAPLHLLDPDDLEFPAVVVPDPARHHPLLSRKGGAGDVRLRQEQPLPQTRQQTTPPQRADAVVGARPRGRFHPRGHRQIRPPRRDRVSSDARPVGGHGGGAVGGPAGDERAGICIGALRGHRQPGPRHPLPQTLRAAELLHDLQAVHEPAVAFRFSLCGGGGGHRRPRPRELPELFVQGRRRRSRAEVGAGAVHLRDPRRLRLFGRRPRRPRHRPPRRACPARRWRTRSRSSAISSCTPGSST